MDARINMQTAEEVLSKTYVSFMKNWGLIQSLRQVAEIALPIAKEQLAQQNAVLVDFMSKDPDFKTIVVMKDGTEAEWSKEVKTFFGTGMTDTSIGNFTAAIDAASIVFAQSILDDCALSFLRVCAIAAPSDWDPYVNDRRVDFNTIKAKELGCHPRGTGQCEDRTAGNGVAKKEDRPSLRPHSAAARIRSA